MDAQNCVIGRGTRADIHQQGLLHRAVHILVKNGAGQFFVQLRSQTKDNNPGLWDSSAAGHVNSGETYIDCAVRELSEELGIQAASADFQSIGQRPATKSNGFEFQTIYLVMSDADITLHPQEVEDGRWLSVAELDDWLDREPVKFTADFIVNWDMYKSFVKHANGAA